MIENEVWKQAYQLTQEYLSKLLSERFAPPAVSDHEQYERNRVLRSYAKAAVKAIMEHMP